MAQVAASAISSDGSVSVNGYASDASSAQSNLSLSEKRADAVRAALIELGVDPDHIATFGHGAYDAAPQACSSTQFAAQVTCAVNQRVTVSITTG